MFCLIPTLLWYGTVYGHVLGEDTVWYGHNLKMRLWSIPSQIWHYWQIYMGAYFELLSTWKPLWYRYWGWVGSTMTRYCTECLFLVHVYFAPINVICNLGHQLQLGHHSAVSPTLPNVCLTRVGLLDSNCSISAPHLLSDIDVTKTHSFLGTDSWM